mmetsp:Transcript_64921/g.205086  ORF Transcript_64921/g.205086 Transcript_64921/m.205086 type:complete len:225 (-) Transcript_64921:2-676(-)
MRARLLPAHRLLLLRSEPGRHPVHGQLLRVLLQGEEEDVPGQQGLGHGLLSGLEDGALGLAGHQGSRAVGERGGGDGGGAPLPGGPLGGLAAWHARRTPRHRQHDAGVRGAVLCGGRDPAAGRQGPAAPRAVHEREPDQAQPPGAAPRVHHLQQPLRAQAGVTAGDADAVERHQGLLHLGLQRGQVQEHGIQQLAHHLACARRLRRLLRVGDLGLGRSFCKYSD